MGNALVINSSPTEVRVALLEHGVAVEVYVERETERGVVGNIYCGRVSRVLPGMQAAFVDIGLERTAFLYVNDAVAIAPGTRRPATGRVHLEGADQQGGEAPQGSDNGPGSRRGFRGEPVANIADVLSEGQDVLVQVQKEPLGTKGARLSCHVTLPGRYLVFMPLSDHVGVSHRIENPEERERLRQILTEAKPERGGFIARTAAESVAEEQLKREVELLAEIWRKISDGGTRGPSPRLLFSDLDLVLRATRDLFGEGMDQIVVDDPTDCERVRDFVSRFAPQYSSRVQLYTGTVPIFDHFGVEVEIQRALDRTVWLKSGGHIVIDEAEALAVIDVNSGRFVGKSSLEDTITQTNLEAVKEIAYQLRLRNIGGIIIIDFIDMAREGNREKVLGALEEALRRDKTKSTIVRMSEIGLVEMTRKRVRESLGHVLTEPCAYCKGRGFVKSAGTMGNEALRALRRHLCREASNPVLINMEEEVADFLYSSQQDEIDRIEQTYDTRVIPVARQGYHRELFEIVGTPSAPSRQP